MNKKNMILMSTLLVCSLESFAQSNAEVTDSLWKDVDLNAVTVVASKPQSSAFIAKEVKRQSPTESMAAVKSWKILAQLLLPSRAKRSSFSGRPRISGDIM